MCAHRAADGMVRADYGPLSSGAVRGGPTGPGAPGVATASQGRSDWHPGHPGRPGGAGAVNELKSGCGTRLREPAGPAVVNLQIRNAFQISWKAPVLFYVLTILAGSRGHADVRRWSWQDLRRRAHRAR